MIGSTVKILGELYSDENLVIEGEVEGSIHIDEHELTIGPSGRIHANITGKAVKIDGLVDGDITGRDKVVISKSGNVRGNIQCPRVILEDGGQFRGTIDMGPALAQPKTPELPLSDFASAAKPARTETPLQVAVKSN